MVLKWLQAGCKNNGTGPGQLFAKVNMGIKIVLKKLPAGFTTKGTGLGHFFVGSRWTWNGPDKAAS